MFLLKKILTLFLMPVGLILLTSLSGLCLLWFSRRQQAGKVLVTVATIALGLLSFQPVAHLLLRPLETAFPVLDSNSENPPAYVVVLGGGQASDPRVPAASRLNPESLVRTIEGVSILRRFPSAKIVFSGGSVYGGAPEAETMAQVAKQLGIAESAILTEASSRTTEDNAALTKGLVGTNRVILVTSACHMPRAIRQFRLHDVQTIPAPIGHLAKESDFLTPDSVLPNAKALWKSEHAVYEYLALTWLRIRGCLESRLSKVEQASCRHPACQAVAETLWTAAGSEAPRRF